MNQVNWFEIPVADINRAEKFYAEVFNVKFEHMDMHGIKMAMFPFNQGAPNATGALVQGEQLVPSMEGTTIYFSCEDVNNELKKIEGLGGKVLNPKTSIGEHGFVAHFVDSEGNKVALHSMQ